MAKIDITAIEQEIRRGLPNETERLDRAKANIQVYHGTHIDPELTYYDRDKRARRDLPLMGKVIDALTSYAYREPPARIVAKQEQATRFLEKIYEQNHITTLMRASDRYRHAADVFAVQVHATGDPEKPIKLYSWTADSIVVWCDPEDQTEPIAVCTIDRFDNQTRYRLWTAEECRTYVTKKWNGETAGGRVPDLQSAIPNPYGILPFQFFHLLPPVTQFCEGGIGGTLSRMERHINFRLMENADHLRFSKPTGLPPGRPCGERPDPPASGRGMGPVPGQPPERCPSAGIQQPRCQVDRTRPSIGWKPSGMISEISTGTGRWRPWGCPAASIPLDKAIIATVSGAALIARNIPLFLYARKTQEQYRHYEQGLAKIVLTVADRAYGGLADALSTPLTVTFGEVVPDLPPDSPDDYLDGLKDRGELSEIQVVMKRFGLAREQAIEHLDQVAKDAAELAKIRAKYGDTHPETAPPLAHDDEQAVVRTNQNEDA